MMPESHVRRTKIEDSKIAVPVDIQYQYQPLDVDELGTELSAIDEIDTASATSPVEVITPSSGKKIDIRGVYLSSNSNSGEAWAEFANSGKLIAKIYCAVQKAVPLAPIHSTGAVDEKVRIVWSGLSTNAKIFYAIRYKEV